MSLPKPSRPWTLHNASKLYQSCGEVQRVHELATAVITIATAHKFAYRVAQGRMMQGWTLIAQGRGVEAARQIEQGLETLRALGGGVAMPYFLALLAEAYGQAGQAAAGLAAVAEALNEIDTTGAGLYAAKLYRLRGELLVYADCRWRTAEWTPEDGHQKALDIARRQQARSLELRAAMSLAHLWQCQGKRQDAYDLLTPVYGWFSEGFDTVALKKARGLLDELE